MTGAVDECEVTFGHEMSVRRIYESPRVTKPYTDAQWQQIDALGRFIDAELAAHDVRLTMGGEPTFVSIDDMDGAEWNFTALGPAKRHLAGALVRRLKKRFAPGALLHFGQGKWYPGESLPRWAFGCWWRRDGVPLWRDDVAHRRRNRRLRAWRRRSASRFIHALAEALAVDRDHVIPAYEDVWHYLMAERRLPVNVDPLKSELKNEEERARLARVFEQGLDASRRLRAAGEAPGRVGPAAAGRAGRGFSALSISSSSRAIRRSATGCRSTRCRGPRRPTTDDDLEADPFAPSRSAAAAPARGPPRSARGNSGAARARGAGRAGRGPAAGARRVCARRRFARRSASSRGRAASTCSCRRSSRPRTISI